MAPPPFTVNAIKKTPQKEREQTLATSCSSATPCACSPLAPNQVNKAASTNVIRQAGTAMAAKTQHSWQVNGMDCPSCAAKISNAVRRVTGIEQVEVFFATEKLTVTLAGEHDPQEVIAAVTAAVQQAGFQLATEPSAQTGEAPLATQPATSPWANYGQKLRPVGALLVLAGLLLCAAIAPPPYSEPLFILATLFGLWPVARKAFLLIQSGSPFAIETLMTVAAIGALWLGETAEAAMVLLLFMFGEQLERYAAKRARAGVSALMALRPDRAVQIIPTAKGEVRRQVSAKDLQLGDQIEIAAGARLPADGVLLSEFASFDESALTGEAMPVTHQRGEKVLAGCVALDVVARLEVSSLPGQNAIDRIIQLIEQSQQARAPIERFIDRFSRWYTPAIMLLALLVAIVPVLFFAEPWPVWIYRALTLLLIGCPCALVISTPAAVTSALAAAAKQGALIKGGAALERLAQVDLLAFDKTGTLTLGKPQLKQQISLAGSDDRSLLAIAAGLEQGSHHPLAQAFLQAAQAQQCEPVSIAQRRALAGIGVQGELAGQLWQLRSAQRLPKDAVQLPQLADLEGQGYTVVVLGIIDGDNFDNKAIFALQDTLREDAKNALEQLKAMGIKSVMLTGDNPRSAQRTGQVLAIDWQASLMPEDKVNAVAKLAQHHHVAMVGDGINDAPAMQRASIGIAMASGTDVALETADAALTHNQLTTLVAMIRLSRAALVNIRQNIAIALGLKALFLVTTLLGLTGLWIAVLADTGATALVTANALRLLQKR